MISLSASSSKASSNVAAAPPPSLLLLIPHLGGGGAERVTAQLCRHLDPARFRLHLGVLAADAPGAESAPAWVSVHRLNVQRVRRAWLPLLRLIWMLRPAIILSSMAHLNFLMLALKPLLPPGTRLLIRQNTTASAAAQPRYYKLAYRALYPLADTVVCQSQAMADDLIHHFGLRPRSMAVLPNPIDLPHIEHPSPGAPTRTGPNLLAAGRLSHEKGMDLLLRALPRLLDRYPHAHLTILGAGPEETALQTLIRDLGLEPHVHLAGHVANPANYHAGTTLFILPSRHEGMPNALLEAAAAGLPLVATPCSQGLSDLLGNAPGAWLSPAITPESLAQTILKALKYLEGMAYATHPDGYIRFSHAFLRPFETQHAIAAYTNLLLSATASSRATPGMAKA